MTKGRGMGYSGGKSRMGKKSANVEGHCPNPSDVQTRTESSKSMGLGYRPTGMKKGK